MKKTYEQPVFTIKSLGDVIATSLTNVGDLEKNDNWTIDSW